MKNRNTIFTTILLALAYSVFSPLAHAVVPPPDGSYPGFNTAEGQKSLFSLTFHYKSDIEQIPQFGAEEVAKVNPALVLSDKEGKPYTVRYEAVNAMLLNEFLKEHRKIEEQGAMIARQQKQIDALTVGLQNVSAQFEASKPAPQVINNP